MTVSRFGGTADLDCAKYHALALIACMLVMAGLGDALEGNRSALATEIPNYTADVAPLLTRYCGGCHNDEEANGELSLSSYALLQKGGESGPLMTPGSAASSRLVGVLTGRIEPRMPPEDETQLTRDEIAVLTRWVDAGAPGPDGKQSNVPLRVPYLRPSKLPSPVTSIDVRAQDGLIAVGRFQQLDLLDRDGRMLIGTLGQHPGKVNEVRFSPNGKLLVVATGVAGVSGEVWLWDVATRERVAVFGGHRDILYTAAIKHDGKVVATAGYDQLILLHDVETGKLLRSLDEHNGAVFDLAFSPDGALLASASADATVKIWRVATGQRLDTRGEPLKEQLTTAIHPGGTWFVGAGGDNRIRMWKLLSKDTPQINPTVFSRFAHKGAVQRLRYSHNGEYLVSGAQDGTIKVWDASRLREVAVLPRQSAVVHALAITADGKRVIVGKANGALDVFDVDAFRTASTQVGVAGDEPASVVFPSADRKDVDEVEPNSDRTRAQYVAVPAQITGTINAAATTSDEADEDLFRITLNAGQTWVMEVNAARQKSPLDSFIEVLDSQGRPVPRVLLQAIRDSYFTFRGKNSTQTGDFRLHNWEEMQMNQLLYCNGEVVRLYHYPRGPDSGFTVFPNSGTRHTFFGTTAITHPLQETCYVVEPHDPQAEVIPNGLPVFTVFYANDDDPERELGSDSRLLFQVPKDGDYFVRLRDVRGFQGDDYQYALTIRPARPHFKIRSVSGKNPGMPRNNGARFGILIDRVDGFDGPVRVDLKGLPPGFHATTPIVVEPGQFGAEALLWADQDAEQPSESVPAIMLEASSDWNGRELVAEPVELGRPKLNDPSKLTVRVEPTVPGSTDGAWPTLEMRRGTTATVHLRIRREEFNGRVGFGNHQAVINAPFGVYVENNGLNGVLIPEGQTEREVFVRADEVTAVGERIVFFRTGDGGSATSNPLRLRILP